MNKYIIYEILTYLSFEEAKTVMLSINNKQVIEHFKKMNIPELGFNGPFQEDLENIDVRFENKRYRKYRKEIAERGLCIYTNCRRPKDINDDYCPKHWQNCFGQDYHSELFSDSTQDDDCIYESVEESEYPDYYSEDEDEFEEDI